MVCAPVGQGEEEDHPGAGADRAGAQAQDVQLSRMERPQDCLQEVGVWLMGWSHAQVSM